MTTPNAAWADYLRQCRWFGGKGLAADVTSIEPLPWYTPPGSWPAVRSELATVSYADGRTETYQLLVAYVPADSSAPGVAVGSTELPDLGAVDFLDAPADPAAMTALVHALRERAVDGMKWLDPEPVDAEAEMRLYTGEQSNTTVNVGGGALFKLFRKLEPGRNLDAEVLAALTGSGITPAAYGVLASPDCGYDLALFLERVPEVTDGWVYATAACASGRDFSTEARALGTELRELHRRLADTFGTATTNGDALSAAMLARFDAAAAGVRELADHRHAARLIFAAAKGTQLVTQRIHGDFHLGQVLHRHAEPSWVIIDFEGEPLKSLAERREFDSVWRDVAGLLRSLDYARSAHAEPDGREALAWCASAKNAFLEGYVGGPASASELLRAYEFDKAVYEVVYEVRNRPDWAHIPWRGVQDEVMLATLEASATKTKEH
ncbi:MAG TPA: phosphotransferase [Propionicimonas sp.]|nr:phosphotransferase [Propionicimonas sp.]